MNKQQKFQSQTRCLLACHQYAMALPEHLRQFVSIANAMPSGLPLGDSAGGQLALMAFQSQTRCLLACHFGGFEEAEDFVGFNRKRDAFWLATTNIYSGLARALKVSIANAMPSGLPRQALLELHLH